jgi:hypothetical protein
MLPPLRDGHEKLQYLRGAAGDARQEVIDAGA